MGGGGGSGGSPELHLPQFTTLEFLSVMLEAQMSVEAEHTSLLCLQVQARNKPAVAFFSMCTP